MMENHVGNDNFLPRIAGLELWTLRDFEALDYNNQVSQINATNFSFFPFLPHAPNFSFPASSLLDTAATKGDHAPWGSILIFNYEASSSDEEGTVRSA